MMSQAWKALPRPRPATLIAAPEGFHAAPRCTVGLLTWNAGEDVIGCMESLLAQTESPLEVIWIDNGSIDGTPERVRARFPQLPAPLVNVRNVGFCGGHNQALAACRTPYYLALNQDIVLAPDYIEKLCTWLDERPELALVSGLILMPNENEKEHEQEPEQASTHNSQLTTHNLNTPHSALRTPHSLYSAGLVFPRVRFAFELGMGGPVSEDYRRRRTVPGVDGSAMMLRVGACHEASLPAEEIFPDDFFAYGEEVDLALRLARAGWLAGVEGTATALHRPHGSGGFWRSEIRAHFLCNHWLLTLRHESLGAILRGLPYAIKGELTHWMREYCRQPGALAPALGKLVRQWRAARRFYHAFEWAHGPSEERMNALRAAALRELRQSQDRK